MAARSHSILEQWLSVINNIKAAYNNERMGKSFFLYPLPVTRQAMLLLFKKSQLFSHASRIHAANAAHHLYRGWIVIHFPGLPPVRVLPFTSRHYSGRICPDTPRTYPHTHSTAHLTSEISDTSLWNLKPAAYAPAPKHGLYPVKHGLYLLSMFYTR